MTYRETLAYIYGLARFGMKPGVERILPLLRALGNPQKDTPVVHIAGTNGKGSTASFIASILMAGGSKVGLFTSPHLIEFNERISINGAQITDDEVVDLAAEVLAVASSETTFFEVVTAMAFLHFFRSNVDVAVVEAGMGGGRDATNLSSNTLLSVITPISLDHCQYLGSCLAEIAREKGGIMRPGHPVVVAAQPPEALAVLAGEAKRLTSPFYSYGTSFTGSWNKGSIDYSGLGKKLEGLRPGIPGRYQLMNAATAICSIELLGDHFSVGDNAIRDGIASAKWPGRMELIETSRRIVLDGAHNPAGSRALAESLSELPRERVILIAGIMADKDWQGVMAPLLPLADTVIAVTPAVDRALPAQSLFDFVKESGLVAVDGGSVASGIDLGCRMADEDDLVVVCGSLFTVGEARAYILKREFQAVRG